MPPHKCSYFRCQNTSEATSMFRFPWSDANRLEVWLNNCGNMTIAHLPPKYLRSRYLCIDHFNKKFVCNKTGYRKRLLRTAIPDHYQAAETEDCSSSSSPGSPHLKVQTPQKVYRNRGRFCEVEDIYDVLEEENRTLYWSMPKRRRIEQNEEDIDTTKYGTRDSITSPGVSRLDEDKVAKGEAPQTSKDAPMEIIENTQTLAEIKRREETIERYKGYTIIANVYHYLRKEYELLKCQLGKTCDLSSLANILERTAAATGVTQRVVTAALDTVSIRSDHTYSRGNTRSNTASKSKKAGSSVNVRRKSRTHSYKQQDDESDGEGLIPPKRRTASNSVKSKPTNEEQLPQDHDSEGEGVRPPKRRSARNSFRNIPSNEEQLPFPSPILFGVSEVMVKEFKAEPADDECQQTLENDPLGPVSQFPIHCRTPEGTETVFKAEPPDDECLQEWKTDPLETESSSAALEEPSDASGVEMKLEGVDDEYADLCTDYSICDPELLDIKPEPPLE